MLAARNALSTTRRWENGDGACDLDVFDGGGLEHVPPSTDADLRPALPRWPQLAASRTPPASSTTAMTA